MFSRYVKKYVVLLYYERVPYFEGLSLGSPYSVKKTRHPINISTDVVH
jgi:hypothetical protein